MTETFRLKLSQAQEASTNWPTAKCFKLENEFCARCNREERSSPLNTVYGVNGDGEIETRWRYGIREFRCARHIEGEVQPSQ